MMKPVVSSDAADKFPAFIETGISHEEGGCWALFRAEIHAIG
jgi:hypothetical protein